jgi:hypothetical protein
MSMDLKQLSSRLQTASTAAGENRLGDLVMKVGRIARPTWKIRHETRPEAEAFQYLTLNDVVFVERSTKGRPTDPQSWLYVYARPGNGDKVVEGWVNSAGVFLDPPEPEAEIHFIMQDEKLINIAAEHYKPSGGFEWGDDARFYVAALAFVNKDYGALIPQGLTDADFKERGVWKDIGIKAHHAIWIPKREFLEPLKGSFVSSGSISYELWTKVRDLAAKVWEAVVGSVAFAAGLISGALLSVYDMLEGIVELIKLAWKILRSLFTLEMLDDAKKLWDTLKGIDWGQALTALANEFIAKWDADSTWARWYFQGQVFGYIIATVILAVLTGGATAEASAAGEGSIVARLLRAIAKNPVVAKVLEHPVVKKITEKAKSALSKARELKERLAKGAIAAGGTLARVVMEERLVELLAEHPELKRLLEARRLTGDALKKEVETALEEWAKTSGWKVVEKPNNVVQELTGRGNLATLQYAKKELWIEKQVYQNAERFHRQVAHELAAHALGVKEAGYRAVYLETQVGKKVEALEILDKAFQEGDLGAAIAKLAGGG